ncbi:MAG: DUF5663 domain-containing protein [Candidatus Peribacteria bacterium]|jgi:hypothetical protein|nr:DUF5663 domain-containing protein [Candidatus Peribacteria bacterium]
MSQISDNQQPEITNDEQFLDETLTLAGFDPERDDFELLKEELLPLLEERITLKIYQALPTEEDRKAFDKMMTSDEEVDSEVINDFFTSKIPNFDDFMADIYIEFQDEYLEAMKGE